MKITVTTYITPQGDDRAMAVGTPNPILLPTNASLDDLIELLFPQDKQVIGIIEVNGVMVRGSIGLSENDSVRIYGLIEGG